jgi:hypothetical protein
MLVLSTLHDLLSQLITPLDLHIAALLTPSGQLVSYAAAPSQTKDDARVLAAVGAQIWQSKSRQSPSEQSAENEARTHFLFLFFSLSVPSVPLNAEALGCSLHPPASPPFALPTSLGACLFAPLGLMIRADERRSRHIL